jgi:hypothetical protein
MGGTQNLPGTITQLNLTSINGQIAPQPIKFALMFDFATTIAFRASASVFIRFNENQKVSFPFIELITANNQLF